jgi:hypothetical protein
MSSRRLLRDLLIAVAGTTAITFVAFWALNGLGNPNDVRNYYDVNLANPYHEPYLGTSSFVYTPAFAILVAGLHLLPFPLVATAWRLGEVAALLLVAGPFAAIAIFTPWVASELNLANINIYIALAAVLGLRWPKVWAFVLITKPSCGIALLWFVARRDWRALRSALAATAAFVIVSLVLIPHAWPDYFSLVTHPAPSVDGSPILWVRLPVAALVAVVGSLLNWRPAIVIAVWLGLPVWEGVNPAVLVGVAAFYWHGPLVDRAWRTGLTHSRWSSLKIPSLRPETVPPTPKPPA